MIKHEFVLTELEAIGKDIEAIVKQEKDQLAMEERDRQEREKNRKEGEAIGVRVSRYDPDKFIPELSYLETRFRAVQSYLAQDQGFNPHQI